MLCGVNREDVVQAALTVERWCSKNINLENCDCPFDHNGEKCALLNFLHPCGWNLEEFLRTRGLKDDD